MKRALFISFFILAMGVSVFSQSLLTDFQKAREIKLLESTREHVKKIFAGYENDDDEDFKQTFSSKNAEIEVTFSNGDCDDYYQNWNVPEWIATKVVIYPENEIKVTDFKFDFNQLTKETPDEDFPKDYIFQSEIAGIIFEIEDDEIRKITLFPPKNKIGFLCNNEKTLQIFSGEEKYIDSILEELIICRNYHSNVTEIKLSASEIISDCKNDGKPCPNDDRKISVTVVAIDPENDPLTYIYTVSGGKITGTGFNVVWDLSGVPPGTYTIMAGSDDGCGVCGETKTETVTVK